MKLLIGLVAALGACNACAPPGGYVGPVPAGGLAPATVLGELVEAGCIAPDDNTGTALAAVVDEHTSDAEEPWLACLFDGGTVVRCGAPCGSD